MLSLTVIRAIFFVSFPLKLFLSITFINLVFLYVLFRLLPVVPYFSFCHLDPFIFHIRSSSQFSFSFLPIESQISFFTRGLHHYFLFPFRKISLSFSHDISFRIFSFRFRHLDHFLFPMISLSQFSNFEPMFSFF